jgi:starch-binding outer membrane protein, SusD/RagB family
MKKFIYLLIPSLLVLNACNEAIIEIQDPQAVNASIALRKTSGIDAVLRSAYRRMHEFNYYGQAFLLNPEALADNLVIANNTGRYTTQVTNTVNAHMSLYDRYPTINDCNIALQYVDDAEGTQADRDRYKGEAYFLRALVYHDLVKVYGYEPGKEVNGFNLGVILRTTPTEGASDADLRARSTVAEVYTQIKADLTAAISFLPAEASLPTTDRIYRASKAAAKALLARVHLYEGNYAAAETMATEALAETSKTLVASAGYVNSWNVSNHPESIFELNIASADWSTVDGVNNGMASITNSLPNGVAAGSAQFAVSGSAELMAAFEAGDIRRTVWVTNSGRNECKKWRGELGDFRENIPVIRVSEVVLIQAEARARKAAPDVAGAQASINLLRSNRNLPATGVTGQALLNLILNENRVEFCFEGHRWFDLKRLGLDFSKPASLNINTLTYSDFRVLAPFPTGEIVLNTLLEQNPNY